MRLSILALLKLGCRTDTLLTLLRQHKRDTGNGLIITRPTACRAFMSCSKSFRQYEFIAYSYMRFRGCLNPAAVPVTSNEVYHAFELFLDSLAFTEGEEWHGI